MKNKIINKLKLGLAGLVLVGSLNRCKNNESLKYAEQNKEVYTENIQDTIKKKLAYDSLDKRDASFEDYVLGLIKETYQNERIDNLQTEIKYNEKGNISEIICQADKNNDGKIDYINQSIFEYNQENNLTKIIFLYDKNGDGFTDESEYREY